LDKIRGNVSREEFLEKLIASPPNEHANESDDSRDQNELDNSARKKEALEKLDAILLKISQIDDIHQRMEELERNHRELTDNLMEVEGRVSSRRTSSSQDSNSSTDRRGNNNNSNNNIKADDGRRVKTFNFSSEEPASPGPHTHDYDNSGEVYEEPAEGDTDYNFVFGCWYCKGTVNELDIICPSCGNQLDGQLNGTEWLEQMGDGNENYYTDEEWDNESEYANDSFDEEYDPSVTRIIYDNPDSEKFGRVGPSGYREFGQKEMNLNIPPCNNCGGNTEYIDRYDRWYCYKCSTYLPRLQSRPGDEIDNNHNKKDRSRVLENIINRRHTKKRNGGKVKDERPLMYYGPYASSDVVTKISMVEDDNTEDDGPVIKKKILR
jgi:ribosomal protein S27AE